MLRFYETGNDSILVQSGFTRELLNQWIARIGTFLGIPAEQVGILGNGKKQIGEKITVSLVQSVHKCVAKVSLVLAFSL